MTELAIREAHGVVVPEYRPAQVAERDIIDGWIQVLADVSNLANFIAETDFVPKALRNRPAAVAACILTGRELGIGPMQSLKAIHMVQGVPSLSAEYKRARALAAGHEIVFDDTNGTRCVVRGRRLGTERWVTITWTTDMARRAKLDGKDVWRQYPQRMLQARATSELCDILFPDASLGLATSEVLEDGGIVTESGEIVDAATGELTTGTAPAIEAPKPRTAQRRQRPQSPPPAAAVPPSAAAHPPAQAAAGGGLPPLPGEEEITAPVPGGDAREAEASKAEATGPGAAEEQPGGERHRKLVGIVQQHFARLGYTDADRDARLADASKIILGDGYVISSLNDLTPDELSTVADTLAKCRNRDALKAILAASEATNGE